MRAESDLLVQITPHYLVDQPRWDSSANAGSCLLASYAQIGSDHLLMVMWWYSTATVGPFVNIYVGSR